MTLNPLEIMALPGLARTALRSVGRAMDGMVPGTNSFADHLNKAQSDSLPVKVGKGVEIELTKEQLSRLAEAADRAEAEGADTAVVMIDGHALELDVTMRTIRSVIDQSAGVKVGIDAIVYADPAPEALPAKGPDGLADNSDIRKILGDRAA